MSTISNDQDLHPWTMSENLPSTLENLVRCWQGRAITLQDACTLIQTFQDSIGRIGLSNPSFLDPILEKFLDQRAQQSLFALASRQIQPLTLEIANPHHQTLLKQVDFESFWKKHKKEIIITAIAVAVIVTVVAITIATSGAGSTAATAAGAAALGGADASLEDLPEDSSLLSETLPTPKYLEPIFAENGVFLKDGYYPYWQFVQKANQEEFLQNFLASAPKKTETFSPNPSEILSMPSSKPPRPGNSWSQQFFEVFGREVIGKEFMSDTLPGQLKQSHVFSTDGKNNPACRIGGINGINTSLDSASDHANYLKNLSDGQSIEWVYNNSHGAIADLLVEVPLNYSGISPNTAHLLTKTWETFYQENLHNPKAKYLQFCHSQGAIHVKNALENTPQEIKDRLIIVAIAPGAIISRKSCFKSYNYASKKDIVPYGELFFAGLNDPEIKKELLAATLERYKELKLLEPHPDASGLDHDFQSPTYKNVIQKLLEQHILSGGIYD